MRHGFFTRAGGASGGLFASFNCGFGSGDEPALVEENRRRALVRLAIPASGLVTAYQVHSARVVRVDRPWARDRAPEADGLVTTVPGVALGILTADCAPVLFGDPGVPTRSGSIGSTSIGQAQTGPVIGACHAGWKGALGGIVAATVAAMVALGARPERMTAAVGPCIGQRSYEVGGEFRDRFLAADTASGDLFVPSVRAGHHLFDLGGYVCRRLVEAGVGRIHRCFDDTAAEPERFFSFRRATLSGETAYGRNLSVIALVP